MLFIAFLAALVGSAIAIPLESRSSGVSEFFNITLARSGDVKDIVIRNENTLNDTSDPSAPANFGRFTYMDGQRLRLAFVNNFNGGALNAYVTAQTMDGQVVVLGSNGQWVYPRAYGAKTPVSITESIAHPLSSRGGTVELTLPNYVQSARVWFAEGQLKFFVTDSNGRDGLVQPDFINPTDPSANVNWGFVELTHNPDGVWANISFVDFVGLEMGMKLTRRDGSSQNTPGLQPGAVRKICSELIEQSKRDGQPWNKLCIADSRGNPIRILSPEHYNPMKYSNYWNIYVDHVWAVFAQKPLRIDTQSDAGVVNCRVSSGILNCNGGDNRGYAKPSTSDIWGCNSGPFANDNSNPVHKAVVARLCAGFVRSTLLMDGGDVQPNLPEWNYYSTSPTNHYSRIVHKYEVKNIGYAFPYDDVVTNGGINTSGVLAGQPDVLTIYVGAPPS